MTDETQATEGVDAPEETVEQATQQPVEPTETGEEPQPESESQKSGFQQRISELVNQRKAAEQQAEYWRQQAQQAQKPQEPPAEPEQGAPVPDSFRTYEEYLGALADFKVEQRLSAREQERQQQERQRQLEMSRHQDAQTFASKAAEARSRYPDFDVVVGNPNTPITETMVTAFARVENGADVAYQLASNPTEAFRVSQLSPELQMLEIGRMSAAKASRVPPAAVSPVQGATGGPRDPMKLSADEWAKLRNEEIRKRGR